MKLSAVVLTKNNNRQIEACIKALSFCDETVVIDDYSSDNTIDIALSCGAKIFQRHLNKDYSAQRNFALSKTIGDWVLYIDSDERVSKSLSDEIIKSIRINKVNGFFIRRIDNLWGRDIKHGETGNIKLLRLARRNSGEWVRAVHERWIVKGETRILKNAIIHYPHQNLKHFISDINFYSDLHAKANLIEGKRSNLFKIIIYPKIKFIKNFIINLGFLDGVPGLVISLVMSFHSFLAWSKLWVLQKK